MPLVHHYPHFAVFFRILLAALLVVVVGFSISLPHPGWGLLTIAFLGLRVELGTVYVKSIARIVGTVLGGCVGALLVIWFAEQPILLIGSLSLVVIVCTGITSRFQGMVGYGGFLGCFTCLLVATFCLQAENTTTIGYFTLYRLSEICLGVIALLISSFIIWPSSSQMRLSQAFATMQKQLAQLATLAENPQDDHDQTFIAVHTQLSRVLLDTDQQRYYITFLDHRLRRVSGSLQRLVFDTLNQISEFVMLRRILLRHQHAPQKSLIVKEAINHNYCLLNKRLGDAVAQLASPERLRQCPEERAHDSLLDLRNHRDTLYRSLTVVAALCMGFLVWTATETPYGPLMTMGCVIITMVRILARVPRIPLRQIVAAVATTTVVIFIIQYGFVIQVVSFWPFFLLSLPIQALVVWNVYRAPTNLIGILCVILIPFLMPVANPPAFQPFELLNNILALFTGFVIGYCCIETIGNPSTRQLQQDYRLIMMRLLHQTMDGKKCITPEQFRREALPINFEMLRLYSTQQEEILNWMDTATTMGSMNLKLKGLANHPDACAHTIRLHKKVLEQMAYVVDHLHFHRPNELQSQADRARQTTMDALFDEAWELYNQRRNSLNLDLLLLAGMVRRHHQLSHPAADQPLG